MNIRGKAIETWDRFFFQAIPACSLGLFRIVFAFVLLITVVGLAADASVWYGEAGVLPLADAAKTLEGPRLNLLALIPQSDLALHCFLGVFLLAIMAQLIGFQTRLASIIVWACLVSMHHRNVFPLNSGDHLMRTLSFFLMFAPAGRAYSVDRLLRLRRGLESPEVPYIVPWAQRLLQIQVCVMYFNAVLYKLAGTHWIDGTAAWYISQLDEFKRFPVPDLVHTLWFSQLATWSSLAIEAALATLIWIRPLRRYVLIAGVMLHLGLEYTMNIPFFQWVVLSSYILFLDTWMGKPQPAAVSSLQIERSMFSLNAFRYAKRKPAKLPRMSQPAGFTLIELLIAIAILGILVALLMPAVQSVRAAARRMQCKNQLRQLGVGLHLYHDSHICFPAGSYVMGPADAIQSGWGWSAMILPTIDQSSLYDLIDFGQGTATGNNLAVIETSPAFWRCPSDLDLEHVTATPVGNLPYELASGNYCGSEGILSSMSSVRIAQVSDGTSHTFLLGERLVQPGFDGSLPFTSSWCGHVAFATDYDSCSIPHLLPNRVHFLNVSVTDPNCFGSRHAGGANFLLADGSLCFISDSIDAAVYEALGTANGREVAQVP